MSDDRTVTIQVSQDLIRRLYSPLDPDHPMRSEDFGRLAAAVRDALERTTP